MYPSLGAAMKSYPTGRSFAKLRGCLAREQGTSPCNSHAISHLSLGDAVLGEIAQNSIVSSRHGAARRHSFIDPHDPSEISISLKRVDSSLYPASLGKCRDNEKGDKWQ